MSEPMSETLSELKAKLKTLEDNSKQLSKQIGLAKKNNDPSADELISQKKQLHAQEIDPVKARIKELKRTDQKKEITEQPDTLCAPAAYPGLTNTNNGPETVFDLSTLELTSDFSEWDNYVEQHPSGTIYYQSGFLSSIHKSLGHRVLLLKLSSKANNSIIAALPIIEQKSALFGHLWTSIALVNYGGVLANSKHAEQLLLSHAQAAAEKEGIKRLEVRGLYERPVNWPASKEKASMWLKLPKSNSSDELLNSFKAKLRSQIKKGYTEQVTYKTGGAELLEDYYTVFARNMRDLGTPVYGKNLFKDLLNDLGENAKLILVYYDEKPASAAFLIKNKSMMEIPWASTIRDYNKHNLNMVLYWEVLKYSCEQKCDIFDFGRSTIDATTYKFKKQWGAQPIQHYWYSYAPNSNDQKTKEQSSSANTNNPKFQLLIQTWKCLPLWLANLVGPYIVKYIP